MPNMKDPKLIIVCLIIVLGLAFTGVKLYQYSQSFITVRILMPEMHLFDRIELESPFYHIVDAASFEFDADIEKYYREITVSSQTSLEISYHGINVKADTTIQLNKDLKVIEPPAKLKNYYEPLLEYFKFTIDTAISDNETVLVSIKNKTEDHQSFQNLFSIVDNKDTTYIDIQSSSCFASKDRRYSFIQKRDQVIVTYVEQNYRAEPRILEFTIEKEQINGILDDFIESCLQIPWGLCTSSDRLVIVKGKKIATFIDSSCKWDGISILERQLGTY